VNKGGRGRQTANALDVLLALLQPPGRSIEAGIPCPGARCYTNFVGSVLPGKTIEAFSDGVSTCRCTWGIGDRYRPSASEMPSVTCQSHAVRKGQIPPSPKATIFDEYSGRTCPRPRSLKAIHHIGDWDPSKVLEKQDGQFPPIQALQSPTLVASSVRSANGGGGKKLHSNLNNREGRETTDRQIAVCKLIYQVAMGQQTSHSVREGKEGSSRLAALRVAISM
jgi:hypothetical protein